MKAKLRKTLYFDFDVGEWDDQKPDGVKGRDYMVLRVGSTFRVYKDPEEVAKVQRDYEIPEDSKAILIDNKGNYFGYKSFDDLNNSGDWDLWL